MDGKIATLLYESPYKGLLHDFANWRVDPIIRKREAIKRKGRILPFIRGLRLSAVLIYTIRDILSSGDLEANWGHLLDEDGDHCSAECDIIIHRKGYWQRWNGKENAIMDFRFIEQKNAILVISCKSFIKTSQVDEDYCAAMRPFVGNIWLFAECCGPQSAGNIKKRASESGYEQFWYLYNWSKSKGIIERPEVWNRFIVAVKKLSDTYK